jgi:biopolymer transport protein ExbB/TolQ
LVGALDGILLGVGAVLEFGGIVALAFPDFLPHGRRLSRWFAHRSRVVINVVRRWLGMKPLQKFVSISMAAEANASGRMSAVAGVNDDATQEEKISFLLRRNQETQEAINRLSGQVRELEEETPRELERLRQDLQGHVAAELAAAEDEYRALRVVGTMALAVGLVCTTVANFV